MRSTLALLALALVAHVAHAQSDTPWNGFYAGVNVGEARNNVCTSSTLTGTPVDSAGPVTLANCPSGGIVGGVQIGENFQAKRLVLGIGADLELWSEKSNSSSLKSTGSVPPSGTYSYSGKLGPNDIAIIGARFGYAGDLFLPYLRVGAIIATGSHASTLSYTPAGAVKPTASFGAGKDFTSSGWVAGGGTEIGLNGAWSITAEYLRVNFGKPSSSTTMCDGPAAACAAFSGITLDTSHNSSTANIFRIGINHWFGYWGP